MIYHEFEKLKREQKNQKKTQIKQNPKINRAVKTKTYIVVYIMPFVLFKTMRQINMTIYLKKKSNKVSQSFYTNTNITLTHFFSLKKNITRFS